MVTVVIPTYQREKLLERAVNSVLNQTYSNWELVISDDDDSEQKSPYLRQLVEQDARIRLVKNEGARGQVPNTNNALRQARGKWIKMLHDDDVLKPNCLTELVELAERYEGEYEIACVTCGSDRYFDESRLFWERREGWPEVEYIPQDQVLITMYMGEDAGGAAPSQKMIHRKVIDAGVFMEQPEGLRLLVDSWFNARMASHGGLLIYRKRLVEWRQDSEVSETGKWGDDAIDEMRLLRDLLWDRIADKTGVPEPAITKDKIAIQRGLWHVGRGRLREGLRLIAGARDLRAWWKFLQWFYHNATRGCYSVGRRLTLSPNGEREVKEASSASRRISREGRSVDFDDRKLKVGFYMFFPGGGIGRYTHELARCMEKRGEVDVEVICTPDFEWKNARGYRTWSELQTISHTHPFLRRLLFVAGQFINPVRCIRHAEERGMDVVHFSNINHLTFPLWRKLLDRSNLRVAATAHDVKRQKSMVSRYYENRQLKAFYRYADLLFVHSEYQVDELVEFGRVDREKIVVVPHGLYPHSGKSKEENRFQDLSCEDGAQTALFFGQIRDEKNLHGFIRAMPRCSSKVHLIIAGHSTSQHRDQDYYKGLAREVGCADQITFISEYIPDDEVEALFDAADWVALPYLSSFTSQSGVLNTAAHFEKPVLVGAAPVLRETVNTCDIGVTCSGDSPEAIADAIDRICERHRENYSYQFAEYKRRYSWEENVQQTVAAYRGLFGG
jgi:glycosyltransferase involved in cell wall biosynthesis